MKDKKTGTEVEEENVPSFKNKSFTNIGRNLAMAHNKCWVYFGKTNPHDMEQCTTGEDEVIKICREINIMKSSGIDRL